MDSSKTFQDNSNANFGTLPTATIQTQSQLSGISHFTRLLAFVLSKYKAFTGKILKDKIMLPVNSKGKPDYEFMHNYMLHIEQKKILEYLEYINKK